MVENYCLKDVLISRSSTSGAEQELAWKYCTLLLWLGWILRGDQENDLLSSQTTPGGSSSIAESDPGAAGKQQLLGCAPRAQVRQHSLCWVNDPVTPPRVGPTAGQPWSHATSLGATSHQGPLQGRDRRVREGILLLPGSGLGEGTFWIPPGGV